MPRRFHEALGVSQSRLEGTGAFNGFVDVDSEFYVDPRLLAKTRVPELKSAHKHLRSHFVNVFKLAHFALRPKADPLRKKVFRRMVDALKAPEIPGTGLGYGKSTAGSGIGETLAAALATTAIDFTNIGIDDPSVFELLGLFEEQFGPDRISDMIVWTIIEQVFAYNLRVARTLGIRTKVISIGATKGKLPFDHNTNKPIVLVPQSVLSDLPVADSFGGIAAVAHHNQALRETLNKTLGNDWAQTLKKMTKPEMKQFLIDDVAMFGRLITAYEKSESRPYDFYKDPLGELRWHAFALKAVKSFELDFSKHSKATDGNLITIVRLLCTHFKELVELRGFFEALFTDARKPVLERRIQKLFYGISTLYCEHNGVGISPEANAGAGPVDFKFTHQSPHPVLVEIKRSQNGHLLHGFTTQLKKYVDAERAVHSFYLVVKFRDKVPQLDRVLKTAATFKKNRAAYAPEVVIVDGQWQKTASKIR